MGNVIYYLFLTGLPGLLCRQRGKSREGMEIVGSPLFEGPQKRMLFLMMPVVESDIWLHSGFFWKLDTVELSGIMHAYIYDCHSPLHLHK